MRGQEKAKLDANDPAAKNEDKRVLGVLPNYRTAELTSDYHPISDKYKLHIALKDSFDYPFMGVGAIYAGFYQLEDSHPQFGQGTLGYLRRFGTSYCDQVVGNMMSGRCSADPVSGGSTLFSHGQRQRRNHASATR